jgi:hypothetical protein
VAHIFVALAGELTEGPETQRFLRRLLEAGRP